MPGSAQYSSTLKWQGDKLAGAAKAGARVGTRKAAEYLKSLAVALAPLRDGPLRESASVLGVNAEPIALVIFDTPYAVIQHEDESYHHTDGQAKYLEAPMVANEAILQGIIAKGVRVAIANVPQA